MHEPVLTVAWPSGELGGMGLEAVRLGFARELDAIGDPAERQDREAALIELACGAGRSACRRTSRSTT